MNLVALIGAHGGVGVTTVTAQLATVLNQRGLRVLAVDLSPSNDLRLHFGMALEDRAGLALQLLQQTPLGDAAYRGMEGIDFVPFGSITLDQMVALDRVTQQSPQGLMRQLERLDLPEQAWVLCDCSQGIYPYQSQVVQVAGMVIVVLNSDTQSFIKARTTQLFPAGDRPAPSFLLLNQFDAARELDQDILSMVRTAFPNQIIPTVIHRDEHVREALASKRSLLAYASSSQAALDFAHLGGWLTEFALGQREVA